MNKEDIIRMAREASNTPIDHHATPDLFGINQIGRFAALVASAEREACAKLLEQAAEVAKNADPQGFVWQAVEASAEVIRARGDA